MNRLRRGLYIAANVILILLGAVGLLLGGNYQSPGEGLLVSGIVGIITYLAIQVSEEYEAEQKQLLKDVQRQGIRRIYDKRLVIDRYKEVRESSSGHFDIMGFGLRTFIEDNRDSLEQWAERFNIRILVVDPESGYCEQRDCEENDPPGKIRRDVEHISKAVETLDNSRVQIRWYKALPVANILRMGDTMFVGLYFVDTRSRNSITFELHAGGELFERYAHHFDEIWNDPTLSTAPSAH